jgi:hypothetical protein
MLLRTLLTAALVAVALTAAVVVDCTTSYVELLGDELSDVCSTVSFLGAESGWGTGVGLAAFAMLGLFATWSPFVKERVRRWRHEPAKALVQNLGRLDDVGSQLSEVEDAPNLVDIHLVARLMRRVEAVEVAITSAKIPSRETTQQWMGLLREANDLHNDGLLDTDDFKKVNTRLLDLFTVPQGDTDELSEAPPS